MTKIQKLSELDTESLYSFDGESYLDYDSIVDRIIDRDRETKERITLSQGDEIIYNHADFIDPYYLISRMQENAADKVGEFSDDYLSSITEEQLEMLKIHIADWLEKQGFKIDFAGIGKTRDIAVGIDLIDE